MKSLCSSNMNINMLVKGECTVIQHLVHHATHTQAEAVPVTSVSSKFCHHGSTSYNEH